MQQPVDINLVTKMKCLLVDDEPLAIEGLKFYAEKLDYIEIIGTCHTAIDAMEIINRHAVDLMFLDINMPDLSGVDFLETLKSPLNNLYNGLLGACHRWVSIKRCRLPPQTHLGSTLCTGCPKGTCFIYAKTRTSTAKDQQSYESRNIPETR